MAAGEKIQREEAKAQRDRGAKKRFNAKAPRGKGAERKD
jgi:hypothetical protein